MFNTYGTNLKALNISTPATQSFVGILQYNGYSMPNQNITITGLWWIYSSGALMKDVFDKANNHGEWLRNYFYKEKYIDIKWVITGDSASDVDNQINSLVSAISRENKVMKIVMNNGIILSGTAHTDWWSIERKAYNITFCEFEFRLVCLNPFLTSTLPEDVAFTAKTATFTDTVQYPIWTYKAQPTITIAFSTWLGSPTSVAVKIGDNTITLAQAISDWDIVIVNSLTQDVSYNWTGGQNYSGVFPELELGDNSLTVTIDSTRTADINVTWNNTYV